MLTRICLLFFASLLLVNTAYSQSGRPTPQGNPTGSRSSTMQVELPTPVAETPVPLVGGGGGQMQTLSFFTPDTKFDEALVKGAPFSADVDTEHVQSWAMAIAWSVSRQPNFTVMLLAARAANTKLRAVAALGQMVSRHG